MSATAGGESTQTERPGPPSGSGSSPAWSSRSSAGTPTPTTTLRVAIEDAIDADMVDGDYGNVVDAVCCGGATRTATWSTGSSTR